jgi:hypothetical protein
MTLFPTYPPVKHVRIAFAGPQFDTFLAAQGADYEPVKKAIETILGRHE